MNYTSPYRPMSGPSSRPAPSEPVKTASVTASVKKQWKFLVKAGVPVGSLKQWAREQVSKGGPWAAECRRWLLAKGNRP